MSDRQEAIDGLRNTVSGLSSVTAGVVAFIAGLAARLLEGADDPEEIRAIAAEVERQKSELAAAITSGTDADGEEVDDAELPTDPEPGQDTAAAGEGGDATVGGEGDASVE